MVEWSDGEDLLRPEIDHKKSKQRGKKVSQRSLFTYGLRAIDSGGRESERGADDDEGVWVRVKGRRISRSKVDHKIKTKRERTTERATERGWGIDG